MSGGEGVGGHAGSGHIGVVGPRMMSARSPVECHDMFHHILEVCRGTIIMLVVVVTTVRHVKGDPHEPRREQHGRGPAGAIAAVANTR